MERLKQHISDRLHLENRHARARVQAFSVFVIAPLLGFYMSLAALLNISLGQGTILAAWPGYFGILVAFAAPVIAYVRRQVETVSIVYCTLFMLSISTIHFFVGGPAGVFAPLILLPVSIVFMAHGPKVGNLFFIATFLVLLTLLFGVITGVTQSFAWPPGLRAIGFAASLIFVMATGYWTGMIGDEIFQKQSKDIRNARDKARYADDAKSRFLADISHELRTPLTGLLGLLEIAERDANLDPATARLIATARASGASLERTVNDLIDLDALEARRLDMRPKSVAVTDVLEDLKGLYGERAAREGVTISLVLPDDAAAREAVEKPRQVDPDRLKQAIGNYLSNAIRYAPAGKTRIWIAALSETKLRISVENDGADVTPIVVNRLFERHSHDTTGKGRTGLGLAITKGLALAMGGDAFYLPRPGGGSVFGIDITAPPTIAPATPMNADSPALDIDGERPSVGLRVLIADDHFVNREVLARMATALDGQVTACENGEDALSIGSKEPFDLMLLDIRMPKLSGDEALKRLRAAGAINAATPAYAVTANASEEQKQAYIQAGFDGVIAKPFSLAHIAAAFKAAAAETAKPSARASVKGR